MRAKSEKSLKEKCDFYMFRPISFVHEQIMGITLEDALANKVGKRLEPQSKMILNALATHDYVSVFSGRGCTKTTSLAMAALWWLWTRNESRVMATGPKYENLKATLWAEIRKWLDGSNLTDEIVLTGEKIYHADPTMHAFGQIMTTKDRENISGVHATHVLWLVDEASNVEQDIIDAILGGMNDPENKIIMTGNPTMASGPFFDSQNKYRKDWYCIRLDAEDSVRKNKVWFKRMQQFPKGSDMYRVYVSGLPPLGNPRAIISLSDCHAAKDRTIPAGNFIELGVDPAREGNDLATIAVRVGMKQMEVRCYPKTKGPELVGHVLSVIREYRRKTGIQSKIRIKIDDHTIGGPIGDDLALNEVDNIEVVPCLFNTVINDERYSDSASEMWFGMAEIIDTIELCDDEELIEELSTREWIPASGNRMKVEPKANYKIRLGRSPDRADAAILCYYKGSKKVFERPDNQSVSDNFDIDWDYNRLTDPSFDGIFMIDVLHYAALVLNDDLSISGIAAVYQHYIDKLWVYAEFYQEHPDPDIISMTVRRKTHKGKYDDDREVCIIGNDEMFGKQGDRQPLSEILMRSGLYVAPAEKYDEYGAIALGIKMYGENQIITHNTLEDFRIAIALWLVKSGKPDASKNGFWKALLLILSEVRRRKKVAPVVTAPRDYRPVLRSKREEKHSVTAWCKR